MLSADLNLEGYITINSFNFFLSILKIKSNGLEIIKQEERILTKEEAAEFYKQHEGSAHFEQLIEFMSR